MISKHLKFITENGLQTNKIFNGHKKKAFRSRSWRISNTLPRPPPLAACKRKRECERTLILSLNFPFDPSANQRTGRESYRNCDSEQTYSRKRWKAIEHFELRINGCADDCYQLKAHRKTSD